MLPGNVREYKSCVAIKILRRILSIKYCDDDSTTRRTGLPDSDALVFRVGLFYLLAFAVGCGAVAIICYCPINISILPGIHQNKQKGATVLVHGTPAHQHISTTNIIINIYIIIILQQYN